MDRKEIEEDIRKIKEHCSRFGRKPSFNEIEWVCTYALEQVDKVKFLDSAILGYEKEATSLRNKVRELEGALKGEIRDLSHTIEFDDGQD